MGAYYITKVKVRRSEKPVAHVGLKQQEPPIIIFDAHSVVLFTLTKVIFEPIIFCVVVVFIPLNFILLLLSKVKSGLSETPSVQCTLNFHSGDFLLSDFKIFFPIDVDVVVIY